MRQEVIGIIGGTGKMGQAFAHYLRGKGFTVLVSGRSTELTPQELAAQADIVIISVPISDTVSTIEAIAPFLKPEAILTDFTSVKADPLVSMLTAHRGAVVGMHPVFGPSNLLPGQTIVFCPGRDQKAQKRLMEIFDDFRIVVLDAEEHDRAMALVQGLQHFLETTFAATIAQSKISIATLLAVSSPVYRIQLDLVGRIIGQDERLYDQIVHGTSASTDAIAGFLAIAEQVHREGSPQFLQAFAAGKKYFGDFCEQARFESDEIIDFLAQRNANERQESRNSRETAEIGTLGPALTWSDLAVQQFFADNSKYLYPSFAAIFSALQKEEIRMALVPIENNISGTVREVWDGIASHDFWIEQVVELSIAHVLATPRQQPIKTVFAHSHALAQCRSFLTKAYPQANPVAVASNSEALVRARMFANAAAICSRQAAESAGFAVLSEAISDRPNNTTRFALIRKKSGDEALTGKSTTTISFGLKNVAGALFGILQIFADADVNLVRLESMPSGEGFAEYRFLIDFEGDLTEALTKKLADVTKDLRVLGHY